LFNGQKEAGEVTIGTKVTDGPIDAGGFDEFHGFHHSRQMKVWIDNDTVTEHIEPIDMLPKLAAGAVDYIQGRKGKKRPFFLYVPWNSPHSPVVPSAQWQGKSGLNAHADFVMQTDHSYGQVIQALKDNGLLANTLVICSSDNGTSGPTSKKADLERMGHFPSADLRGSKADIWDGGHRVPFMALWPQVIEAGSTCKRLVCLTDIMATVGEIVGFQLPANAAEDSMSFLPALKGETKHTRTSVVHHSIAGHFAIRQNQLKLIMCPGSGGWTAPRPNAGLWQKLERQGQPTVQLYDMLQDLGEQSNLAADMPENVRRLRALLRKQVYQGRSTPGPEQANDAPIVIDKRPVSKKKAGPAQADPGAGLTSGIIDLNQQSCPTGAKQLVGKSGYDLVPESDAKCQWTFKDGVLTASPAWDSVVTREPYRDFRMHVEFNVNHVPNVKDPEKDGNSGIYIQQRYEIQILNSYGVSEADYKASYCGSLYRMKKPDRIVNRPAGQWQSFDIAFRAARFDGDTKIENARVTVYQNGVLTHDDVSIPRKTGAGHKEGPAPRPIKLQGHHNPVRFRNVWIEALDLDHRASARERK